MGADRVLAIGVRYYRTPEESFALNRTARMETIRLADISGVLLNSLFLDALDSDLERMNRINQTLSLIPEETRRAHPENYAASLCWRSAPPSTWPSLLATSSSASPGCSSTFSRV